MIEDVEKLTPNLHRGFFSKSNILEQRHVEINEIRPAKRIATEVAEGIKRRNLKGRGSIGRDAVSQISLPAIRSHIADNVRPLAAQSVIGLIV